jgi:hypothetical protein
VLVEQAEDAGADVAELLLHLVVFPLS